MEFVRKRKRGQSTWRRDSAMGLNNMTATQVTPKYIGGCSQLGHGVTIKNVENAVVVANRNK
jgi:hypothetical protein